MSSGTNDAKRDRRRISREQQALIVKQHLIDGKSVSDLCDEHRILQGVAINAPGLRERKK